MDKGNQKRPNFPSFSKPPKAIAIDLDGTLLDSQTRLSERSHRALERCLARGIPVIIATSRPIRIFNRIFPRDLATACSLVVMNGAIAKGNQPLSGYFKETFSEEIARSIVEFAYKFNPSVRITLELDGYEFGTNYPPTDAATLWQRNSATPEMVFSVDEALLRQPCKIELGGHETDLIKLAEDLTHNFVDTISVIPALFQNPMLNVTTFHASKPSALRKLLTPKDIHLEEVLAFGDDVPDIEMLKQCGMSVAMENAFSEVKAVCGYQTVSNDEDGVAMVLEEMLKKLG